MAIVHCIVFIILVHQFEMAEVELESMESMIQAVCEQKTLTHLMNQVKGIYCKSPQMDKQYVVVNSNVISPNPKRCAIGKFKIIASDEHLHHRAS